MKPRKLSGVIFDFDGVITNDEPLRFKAIQKVCKAHGFKLAPKDYRLMLGEKTIFFLRQKFPSADRELLDRMDRERRNLQRRDLAKSVKEIPGIRPLLSELRRRDLKVTIATGSHRDIVYAILRKLRLDQYFHNIVTSIKYSKPHPWCYREALRSIGTPRDETIVIEDAAAGILSARRAGIYAIGITTTTSVSALKKAGAGMTFHGHNEILAWMKKNYF